MNDDTLIVVHAYEGDAWQVREFLPAFLHHRRPILVLSPEDSPVDVVHPDVTCRSAGLRGWKGRQTLERQVAHWKIALEYDWQWVLLNDADSLCLSPEIPSYVYSDPNRMWCNVLCHEGEHLESDRPNLNPPYFMHRSYLEKLVEASVLLDDEPIIVDDLGFGVEGIDGFYTRLVINELQLPYGDFPDGITTWPRGMNDVFHYVTKEGAVFLHGIKSSLDLSLLLAENHVWRAFHGDRPISYRDGETITA